MASTGFAAADSAGAKHKAKIVAIGCGEIVIRGAGLG